MLQRAVVDAAVTTAKVADSAITAAKLADNSSVTLVSSLPASGDFTGQIALDTTNDKIYVWDGSAWDSVKAAGSINVVNGSTSGIVNITTSTSGDTVTVSTTLDDTSAAANFLAGPTGAGGTVGYRYCRKRSAYSNDLYEGRCCRQRQRPDDEQ